jgi:hypothetical protein
MPLSVGEWPVPAQLEPAQLEPVPVEPEWLLRVSVRPTRVLVEPVRSEQLRELLGLPRVRPLALAVESKPRSRYTTRS